MARARRTKSAGVALSATVGPRLHSPCTLSGRSGLILTMTSIDAAASSTQGHMSTAARIIAAARSLAIRGGVATISMGDVAVAAGVSKALIHYHFRDKSSLLCALVENLGTRIVARAKLNIEP